MTQYIFKFRNMFKIFNRKIFPVGYLPFRDIPTDGKLIHTDGAEIVAKVLTGGNETHFFQKNPGKHFCRCMLRLKKELNRKYAAPENRYAVYRTADGYDIVNDAFRQFCQENDYPGLTFVPLPKSPGWYWLSVGDKYEVDWGKGYAFHGKFCLKCEEVCYYYPFPVFKSSDCKISGDDFICRSDIEYGDFGRAPLIIIGLKTEKKLIEAGFRNLYFEPVYFRQKRHQAP